MILRAALSIRTGVLAVDMPGRGRGQWLADPSDYVFPDLSHRRSTLLARSGAETVDWVGTSMGGPSRRSSIAAQPDTPVTRLVVNDVGPTIEPAALERDPRDTSALDPTFATYGEIAQYITHRLRTLRYRSADDQWERLTVSNVRQRADGRWGARVRSRHRGAVSGERRTAEFVGAVGCDPLPDACPARSRFGLCCSSKTAAEMAARGAEADAVLDFAGVGHAPMLLSAGSDRPRWCDFIRVC